ncbi:Hypothetical predicted protein, partial [Xyrichtys novacula]
MSSTKHCLFGLQVGCKRGWMLAGTTGDGGKEGHLQTSAGGGGFECTAETVYEASAWA